MDWLRRIGDGIAGVVFVWICTLRTTIPSAGSEDRNLRISFQSFVCKAHLASACAKGRPEAETKGSGPRAIRGLQNVHLIHLGVHWAVTPPQCSTAAVRYLAALSLADC